MSSCKARGATAINLDASRLIFGGTVATGGGHSLIHKDDVVHLVWSALRLTWQEALRAPCETVSSVTNNKAPLLQDKMPL